MTGDYETAEPKPAGPGDDPGDGAQAGVGGAARVPGDESTVERSDVSKGDAYVRPSDRVQETSVPDAGTPETKRWLARLSLVLMLAAAAVLIGLSGQRGLGMVIVGIVGVGLIVVGAYWFIAHRGVLRWLAAGLVVLTPVAALVLYAINNLVWVAILSLGIALLAAATARTSLVGGERIEAPPTSPALRPKHAFIVMNPRSGGGKVAKFGLKDKAEAAGARVTLLDAKEHVDVAALARDAVAEGCDLLGVAGGDGTQALVAEVAAENDLPLLVISAGTRNHFALDLGLNREDPSTCLDALTDGEELRVDLGFIGGRPFVNNASFGAYAEVVQSPAYRDDKPGTTLQMMPDILSGHRGARLTAHAGDVTIEGPQALLVSNNPYETGDVAGLGRRARLDSGTLGVIGVRVGSAAQALGLLRRGHGRGLTFAATDGVTVDADAADVPVGVDGETIMVPTPVRCTIRPGALRVLVPKDRPGVPAAAPSFDWANLFRTASFRHDPRPPGRIG